MLVVHCNSSSSVTSRSHSIFLSLTFIWMCWLSFRLDDQKIKLENDIYLKMDDPILFLALELYRLPKALVYLFLAYFSTANNIILDWISVANKCLFHWLSFYNDVLWCVVFFFSTSFGCSRIFICLFFDRFCPCLYCCCCYYYYFSLYLTAFISLGRITLFY